MGQDWEQIENLFLEVSALPEAQRMAFLDDVCRGKPEWRSEVNALLTADAAEDGLLDGPLPLTNLGWMASQTLVPQGQVVGRWRILSELGRGGMGVVYLAERADGTYEQQVAMKVIRGGVFAADMEPYFVRERRILGRLQHPGIARLIDAGATADGLPYLVMELVQGEPITIWSQRHSLGIDARLQLMLAVCDALEHAHRNLVVHRDLKPGNIFVTHSGNVRLLDFGVARLLAGPHDGASALTGAEFLPHTPEYAAPEQMSSALVTTAIDVFALGAVLYELLTDTPPRTALSESATDRLRMPEQTIGPPSKAPGLPAERRAKLRGDIDAITGKATAPDASRRYANVAALADDMRRFLAHEPVLAVPERFIYRAGKFVRRHRAGVVAMTAVMIAIIGGITATLWQARETKIQARKAEAVKGFILSLFAGADPGEALGEELTARQLVDTGAQRMQLELVDQPEVRAEILTFLANLYDKMDQDERATELVNEALALAVPGSSIELGRALLIRGQIHIGKGDDDAGLADLQRALPILESHGALVDAAEAMDLMAISRSRQGDFTESVRLTEQALASRLAALGADSKEVAASYNNLGVLARTQGDYAGARRHYTQALDIRRRILPADHPQVAISLNNLGALYYAEGNYAVAADYFEQSLAINRRVHGPLHRDTIAALNNLGHMQMRLGAIDAARRSMTDVYDYWVGQGNAEHPNALVTRVNIATVERTAGNIEAALDAYKSIEPLVSEKLGSEHPILAATLQHEARSLLELGRVDEAAPLLARALAIRNKVFGEDHPDSAELVRDQGLIALLHNDLSAARELTTRALEVQKSKLPNTHPSLAVTLAQLGRIALDEGNFQEASLLQVDALERLAAMLPPDSAERADAHFEYGRSLLAGGDTVNADLHFSTARTTLAMRYGQESWHVAKVDYLKAEVLKAQGRQQEATVLRDIAVARIGLQLPESHPLRREIENGVIL